MTLPNFLIIGAAKSGTSALYAYINQHPQVFMPEQKELRYFSSIDNPENQGPKVYKNPSIQSLEDYREQFSRQTDELAIGEASPQYLYYPQTPKRIFDVLPDIKIISILRNPVKRAYSSYLHAVRDWHETADNFQDAVQLENERITAGWPMLFHYVNAGFYYQQLIRYFDTFDKDQIRVIIYDDFIEKPDLVIRDLFKFLEIDPEFSPDMSSKPNVSGYPKNKFIDQIYKKLFKDYTLTHTLAKKILPGKKLKTWTKKIRNSNLHKIPLDQEMSGYLANQYKDEIMKLQDLLQRKLPNWLNPHN